MTTSIQATAILRQDMLRGLRPVSAAPDSVPNEIDWQRAQSQQVRVWERASSRSVRLGALRATLTRPALRARARRCSPRGGSA